MLKSDCTFYELYDRALQNPIIPGCRHPKNDKYPELSPEPTVDYSPHDETIKSETEKELRLSGTYTVTRPDYAAECEKVLEQKSKNNLSLTSELNCFDHYEFGYSDALCTFEHCNKTLKSYRCNCHKVHTQFATSKFH